MGLDVDWGDGSVGQKVPGEWRESRVLGVGGRSRQGWRLRGDPHPATLPGQSSALARTGHRARRPSGRVRCHPGRGDSSCTATALGGAFLELERGRGLPEGVA